MKSGLKLSKWRQGHPRSSEITRSSTDYIHIL